MYQPFPFLFPLPYQSFTFPHSRLCLYTPPSPSSLFQSYTPFDLLLLFIILFLSFSSLSTISLLTVLTPKPVFNSFYAPIHHNFSPLLSYPTLLFIPFTISVVYPLQVLSLHSHSTLKVNHSILYFPHPPSQPQTLLSLFCYA